MLSLHYFPSFSSFVIILLISFFANQWRKRKSKASNSKSPPGPPRLPLIGNLHQLFGSLPHHALTNLAKKYGPVMHLQIGEQFAVVISSSEAVKEMLKTKELSFAQRPVFFAVDILGYDYSSMVFAPYGNFWKEMRKICVNELLNAKRIQSFRSVREEEVLDLVASVASCEGVAINLSEMIFSTMNDVTSQAVFSNKCKDQSEFMSLLEELTRIAAGFTLPDLYPSLRFLCYFSGIKHHMERLHKKMDKILDNIIKEHKEKRKLASSNLDEDPNHHGDILDMFLNLQESNQLGIQLTNNKIKAVTMDVFSAGTETSASTIEWAIAEMIKNPRVMEKAQVKARRVFKGKTEIKEADIQYLDYLNCIIKETLRMHPPGPLLPREARENCEINRYEIPARARVLVNAWMIGRDPNVWTEPDVFKPERFHGSTVDFRGKDFEYIPFGAGRRICPGISFATSIMELTLAQIIYHFDWEIPDGKKPEEVDMSETFGLTVRKKQNLYLVPTIYVPPFTGS